MIYVALPIQMLSWIFSFPIGLLISNNFLKTPDVFWQKMIHDIYIWFYRVVHLLCVCICVLSGCACPEELTTERAHSAVEDMFQTLRGLSQTRNHLKQLRSVFTASDGVHQVRAAQTHPVNIRTRTLFVTGWFIFRGQIQHVCSLIPSVMSRESHRYTHARQQRFTFGLYIQQHTETSRICFPSWMFPCFIISNTDTVSVEGLGSSLLLFHYSMRHTSIQHRGLHCENLSVLELM